MSLLLLVIYHMSLARFAFLFPGQGAQSIGMAADLCDEWPEARAVFDRGSEILGFDVLEICRKGPEDELASTRVSQPAIFLHSMAALEVIRRRQGGPSEVSGIAPGDGLEACGTAGLSLGEYSALVFAGSISFEDAVRVVGHRGEAMQKACDDKSGTMASVLGLAASAIEEVVDGLRSEGREVWVANYNSPKQTVVSGESEAIAECTERLQAAGARRVRALKVAGAYHSGLMASATRAMEPVLADLAIAPPRLPFYQNFSGARVDDPEQIRSGLLRQVEGSVRWVECIGALSAGGAREGLEVGPGKILKGLVGSIVSGFDVRPVGTVEAITGLEDLQKEPGLQKEMGES